MAVLLPAWTPDARLDDFTDTLAVRSAPGEHRAPSAEKAWKKLRAPQFRVVHAHAPRTAPCSSFAAITAGACDSATRCLRPAMADRSSCDASLPAAWDPAP